MHMFPFVLLLFEGSRLKINEGSGMTRIPIFFLDGSGILSAAPVVGPLGVQSPVCRYLSDVFASRRGHRDHIGRVVSVYGSLAVKPCTRHGRDSNRGPVGPRALSNPLRYAPPTEKAKDIAERLRGEKVRQKTSERV